MARIPVFFSFHYANDVMRVQQIRNIGVLEKNEPLSPNDWEQLKRTGETSVKHWIDENMKHKRCVIVLVGAETAKRPFVRYEIEKAWNDGKGLFGIYIHNLRCPRNSTSAIGQNPFNNFTIENGTKMSSVIHCYNPSTYNEIAQNMESWVNLAIAEAQRR
ncbi:TIR domain-containing protein [Candidatus Electronema sp. PJ]|uniref:TIR domain-containing protein n=1 Tax=Candidatus Electronema sp. PJ TaxID=3401572 RepID=UPI003AA999D1